MTDTMTDKEWEDIPHWELCEMVIERDAEIERLRAAVDVVLAEVGNHHRPNSDGRGCWWCGPGDGSWPCVHRMVLDELKEARRER